MRGRCPEGAEGAPTREDERRSGPLAKKLRKRLTNAEVILWSRLKGRAFYGFHFRRQHPVGPYIADFACISLRLLVEVDGAMHSADTEIKRDARRDAYLRECGWTILRVGNQDIFDNLNGVLEAIRAFARNGDV